MCGAIWIDVDEFPQTPSLAPSSEWPSPVYRLAVATRGDRGVLSGGRTGQTTMLAPSPNLAVSPCPHVAS
jgi:hypothetical protein